MSEFYKVIADIDELKYFFDNVLEKPLDGESIMICHSARAKKLTDEEARELKEITDDISRNWNRIIIEL